MSSLADIGDAIRLARKDLGLTQVQLAELAGITYRPIYLIEDGKSIRLETLLRIGDALGLEVTLRPKGAMSLEGS
jgi:transcriptional regulator with XRE-family HTH domain